MGQDVGLDAATIRASSRHAARMEHARPERADVSGTELDEIARAQHDPRAFAPLYERYVDAIFGYCYRRTSDHDVAADLTSQIFARALAALPRYQAQAREGTFRSWLFSIAHNLVIDAHRTRRDHTSLVQIGDDRPLRDASPSPEDHAITSEDRRELARAMATLTGGQRQVVELRLAGLTGPEIAAVLGMGLPAVKSAQFRAYARLRDLLRPDVALTGLAPAPSPSTMPDSSHPTTEPNDA